MNNRTIISYSAKNEQQHSDISPVKSRKTDPQHLCLVLHKAQENIDTSLHSITKERQQRFLYTVHSRKGHQHAENPQNTKFYPIEQR